MSEWTAWTPLDEDEQTGEGARTCMVFMFAYHDWWKVKIANDTQMGTAESLADAKQKAIARAKEWLRGEQNILGAIEEKTRVEELKNA